MKKLVDFQFGDTEPIVAMVTRANVFYIATPFNLYRFDPDHSLQAVERINFKIEKDEPE